jgi:hypothetical protein
MDCIVSEKIKRRGAHRQQDELISFLPYLGIIASRLNILHAAIIRTDVWLSEFVNK